MVTTMKITREGRIRLMTSTVLVMPEPKVSMKYFSAQMAYVEDDL